MKLMICLTSLAVISLTAQLVAGAKSECQKKREDLEKQVARSNGNSPLAILIPNCNEDGTYASLQCHNKSPFCQCWDKEGIPQTAPKKDLRKCNCMLERAQKLKSIPPSQTDIPEMTSCELDGAYKAKQCDRQACWCVNPDTGKKITKEDSNKSAVKC